jgi:hypothetical protein
MQGFKNSRRVDHKLDLRMTTSSESTEHHTEKYTGTIHERKEFTKCTRNLNYGSWKKQAFFQEKYLFKNCP